MLTALDIENFRGFRTLHVEDLGRVNLIVGRNDCGKTSLAAAPLVASSLNGLSTAALALSGDVSEVLSSTDFELRWRHLFHDGDDARGLRVRATKAPGHSWEVAIRRASGDRPVRDEGWPLEIHITRTDGSPHLVRLERRGDQLIGSGAWTGPSAIWIGPVAALGTAFRDHLARLKVTGEDAAAVAGLAGWRSDVAGIELIGTQVLVRLQGVARLLPVRVLGEGARRVVDIGVSLGAEKAALVAIDEVDAGFHYSVLPGLWAWIRHLVAARDHQVFATTHSDECVLAACRAYEAARDDSLRVIRIDRLEDGSHVPKVFTVARALEMFEFDAEIR